MRKSSDWAHLYCEATMFFRRPFSQFSPRALRFWVLALALLQVVAPVWHVCALGGHVFGHEKAAHHGAANETAKPAASDENAAPQALICYCPPKSAAPQLAANEMRVAATPDAMDHATCLALLLQTLPAQMAAPPAIFVFQTSAEIELVSRPLSAVSIAAMRRFRGRAPPVSV